MGNPDTLTVGALRALREARLIVGAQRLLDTLPDGCPAQARPAVRPDDTAAALCEFPACVVMSGDTGFYSGTKRLLPLLSGLDVSVLPGITTVQYFASRLGRPWQDVTLVSAHGLECNVIGAVLGGRETFFLTGGAVTPSSIAQRLDGMPAWRADAPCGAASVLWRRVHRLRPRRRVGRAIVRYAQRVWAEAVPPAFSMLGGGIADDAFLRGDVPMTKREVRAAIPGLLELQPGGVVWDVGAGTGSVSVELALLDPGAQVFAVEQKPAACDLILPQP